MDYRELQEEATDYMRLWGFLNTSPQPDVSRLVNRAYREMVWEAESRRLLTTTAFTTVSGTAEYTLSAPDYKTILELYYDDVHLVPTHESIIRRGNSEWLAAPSGVPRFFWMVRNNVVRLYPTPNDAKDVDIYAIRAPVDLSASTDVPDIPYAYHDGIAVGAAYYHIKKFAKGGSLEALDRMGVEYRNYIDRLRDEFQARYSQHGKRFLHDVEADRVVF